MSILRPTVIALSATALLWASPSQTADQAAPPNSLVVHDTGNVGVGVETPTAALHVERSNGKAKIKVVESQETSKSRTMLELKNSGHVVISVNSKKGKKWKIGTTKGGFTIDKKGKGQDLKVAKNGDLIVRGVVREGSSRLNKSDIDPVDTNDLLKKLLGLPIHEWSYNHDTSEKHVGPMAQDFSSIFSLGDSSTLTTHDLAGVAVAAIQAQQAQIDLLKTRIGVLQRDLRELQSRASE